MEIQLAVKILLFFSMFGALYSALLLPTGLWKDTKIGKKIYQKKKRSPLKEKLLRNPGETLRKQEREIAIDRMLAMTSLYFVTVIFIIAVLLTPERYKTASLLVELLFTGLYTVFYFAFFRKIKNHSASLRHISLGLDGELATAQALNQLMRHGYYVYHDFPADKFNIDHIVIGKTGIYAVETKTKSKQNIKGTEAANVSYDGNVLNFPDGGNTEFIRQAKEQAKWLSKFLRESIGKQVFVTPVLALPGWMVNYRTTDDSLIVINPKMCEGVITARRNMVDETTITQVKYQIEKECRTVEPYEIL
ncbi:MAG: NERD domain-containing protein [Nitrospirae bacterium]|nr:NERD domain-containing protein [Nitrospirota bacterium]MCL5977638.1 NERD domain-containing protein [Nitrospirota bacterium]